MRALAMSSLIKKLFAVTLDARQACALGLAGLTALASLTFSKPAAAQEYQLTGPLAGAPSSKHLRLYRKNRI